MISLIAKALGWIARRLGLLLIIVGVVGFYYIRQFPGLALFTTKGLLAGIGMIAKATGKL